MYPAGGIAMYPEGRGAAREMERLRYTYRRRLAGLSDDELEEEARRVGARRAPEKAPARVGGGHRRARGHARHDARRARRR